jgi:hypothetical protein
VGREAPWPDPWADRGPDQVSAEVGRMSQAGAALLGLALLVAATQWSCARVVAHVDMLFVPACSKRRVERVVTRSPLVYLASGAVVLGVLCVEGAVLLV